MNRSWPDGTHTDLTWHASGRSIMAGKLYVGDLDPDVARHICELKAGTSTQKPEYYGLWDLVHDDHIVQDGIYLGTVDLQADAEFIVQLHNEWLESNPKMDEADETPAP
jgi:hypothetical protein